MSVHQRLRAIGARLLRASWNGPFYVGRLEKPISTGEAILKLFETVWRAGLIFLVGIAGLIGVLLAVSWWDQLNEVAARDLRPEVVLYSPDCQTEYPVEVRFTNKGAFGTTSAVDFRLVAHLGQTGELLMDEGGYRDESPIAPGYTWGSCWQLPEVALPKGRTLKDLQWSVAIETVHP